MFLKCKQHFRSLRFLYHRYLLYNEKPLLKNTFSNKKENITLSLDKYILDDIKSDIKNTGVSINAKINEILKDYVMYQKVINIRHPVITFPEIFTELIKNTEEKVVIDSWTRGMEEVNPFLHYSFNIPESDIDKFTLSLEWGQRLGLYNSYILRERHDHTIVTFDHSLGLKWSKAMAYGFTKWIENLLGVHPESNLRDNIVILTIPLKLSDS